MKKNPLHFKPGLLMALSFFIFLPDLFYWNVDGHDIWWHLKSSEHLVQHFRFATPDQYSFTANGLHWNQHSWLGALLYYVPYIFFGTDGIIVLTVFTKVITSILFFAVTYFFTNNTTNLVSTSKCNKGDRPRITHVEYGNQESCGDGD